MIESERLIAAGVVLIPLTILWVVALFHINARRSDLAVFWKAIWSALVLLLPYIGVLIYAMVRPPRPADATGRTVDPTVTGAAIEQIHRLVADHDAGTIGDDEFAAGKAAVFGLHGSTV